MYAKDKVQPISHSEETLRATPLPLATEARAAEEAPRQRERTKSSARDGDALELPAALEPEAWAYWCTREEYEHELAWFIRKSPSVAHVVKAVAGAVQV